MINIKDINWIKDADSETFLYNNKLTSPGNIFGHIGDNNFVLITFTGTHWYIHPLHDLITIHGNEGISAYGLFDDIELAKIKATEIIKESILALLDMRDYKLNELNK